MSDWLNGLGMIGIDLPKIDSLFETLLDDKFFSSSLPQHYELDPMKDGFKNQSFRWVSAHEKDQIWGTMTILTTFVPGLAYGLGNILCYVTKTDTYLYDDLSYTSAPNVAWKSLLLILLFPAYVTWLMIRTCFHQDEINFQRLLAIILLEAFLESAPQVINHLNFIK